MKQTFSHKIFDWILIGIMMTIVFHKLPNVIAFIPVAGATGALIGTIIDKLKKKD